MMEIELKQPNAEQIQRRDMDVHLSGAFVIRASFGSLVSLRAELRQLFGEGLIYPTFSSQQLYVVHWNDLSPEKQRQLNDRRER